MFAIDVREALFETDSSATDFEKSDDSFSGQIVMESFSEEEVIL